jgi:hypothetical protein
MAARTARRKPAGKRRKAPRHRVNDKMFEKMLDDWSNEDSIRLLELLVAALALRTIGRRHA